jgi:hypothetical protein
VEGAPAASVFGPYLIVERISQSGTASVYRARDSRHGGRAVALKLFAPHLSADPAFRERFRRDAGLLSALREPHVVVVHTYGVHDGIVYLDMRLVQGRRLAEAQHAGDIDPARVWAVTDQLDGAVRALRAGGLADRNVTADDVLLSGPPGHEFVHVVGLGLGRPPAGAPPDVVRLVGAPPPPRTRRRRWWPVVAVAATLALTVAVIVWVRAPAPAPGPPLVPGQVAALSGEGPVLAAATTTLDGTPVAVAAAGGAIRTWNLTTGRSVAPAIDVDARVVSTIEVDGAPAVVSRGPDQLIRVHRLADGRELGGPIGTAEPVPPTGSFEAGLVREIVTTEVAGRPAVVAVQATETDRIPNLGFAVWSLPAGDPIGDRVSPGPTVTLDLASATFDGAAVVLALGAGGPIQAYEAETGRPVGGRIDPGTPINVIAVVDRAAGPVVVAGCADNSVRLFDLRTGSQVGPALRGHVGSVVRISAVRSGGRDLLVSTAGGRPDGQTETRFWELDGGAPVGPVLVGSPPAPLATAEVDGRGVLVTSAADGAAVWDVAELIGEGAR